MSRGRAKELEQTICRTIKEICLSKKFKHMQLPTVLKVLRKFNIKIEIR